MIYLAAPYSHPNPDIREERFREVTRIAGEMMRHGTHVYSPLTHSHPIACSGGLPTGWDYWQKYDERMMTVCTQMIIVRLMGWQMSEGIKAEIELANRLNLPITYMDP